MAKLNFAAATSDRRKVATDSEIDVLVAAALRRGLCGLSDQKMSDAEIGAFLTRVDFHGVAALLHDRIVGEAGVGLREALRNRTIAQFAWEQEHRRVLSRLLSALADHGVTPILFKGTALAYMVYEDPAQRARGDTDILIEPSARQRASLILNGLGFERAVGISPESVSNQASYVLGDAYGQKHEIDLHWEVNNSPLLASLFSHGELMRRAVPLPRLSPNALGFGLVDALLASSLHRQKHLHAYYHVDGVSALSADRLIWIYDIRLLATALSSHESWQELTTLAQQKGLLNVVLDGLTRARVLLASDIPNAVLEGFANVHSIELPAEYLKAGWLKREWMDMKARTGWRRKLGHVAGRLFPPADQMRAEYAGGRLSWLPWLYALRAFDRIAKRLDGFRSTP